MKVSVIGATGYAGAELLRILNNHPAAEVVHITSESHAGEPISDIYPHLKGIYDQKLISMKEIDMIGKDSDFVFIGLPHGHAMTVGKALENTPCRIIDLGADYRFDDTSVYEAWYKVEHTHKDAPRVYGLAELYRDRIKNAKIIGNAGCYTTASILALAPLAKNHLIDVDTIVIDAKSGVSGAGRSAKQANHFPELYDSFKAYGVATHRHTPEIEQAIADLSGEKTVLNFTPHLVPMNRGILVTAYASLTKDVSYEEVKAVYDKYYQNEKFVRVLEKDICPQTKWVEGSNYVDISFKIDPRTNRIIMMGAIDNLVKGAAGQAVQNMNLMFGLSEDEGLNLVPMFP